MRFKSLLTYTAAACLGLSINAHAGDDIDCDEAITTPEINYCIGKEVKAAEEQLEQYLQASIARYTDDPDVVAAIEKSQETWEEYREQHCSAIYTLWREGTIRGTMYGSCKQAVTERRTYELWQAYLTYMDSTAPVMPEPNTKD
ncbi:MAG TPA: lysozyme inhibitor LprI family protein [Cellvibrionaceae bacterium]